MVEIVQHSSPNFGERREDKSAKLLILHYTDMTTAQEALSRMCDPDSQVSAHYLIEENGQIIQMVAEDKRAWHAGVSYWLGETDINSVSIGIELANPGHSNGLKPFPDAQIQSLIALSQQIMKRHNISPQGVIGHSDIAPGRKIDPGPLFPWQTLAKAGLGHFPETEDTIPAINDDIRDITKSLADLGYDVTDISETISAFQLHYRPKKIDGIADLETRKLIAILLNNLQTVETA